MSSSLIIDEIHMCSISRFDVFRVSQEGEFCIFFLFSLIDFFRSLLMNSIRRSIHQGYEAFSEHS